MNDNAKAALLWRVFVTIFLLCASANAQQADSASVLQKIERCRISGQYISKHFWVTPVPLIGDESALTIRETNLSDACRQIDSIIRDFGGARRIDLASQTGRSVKESLRGYRYITESTIQSRLDELVVPEFIAAIDSVSPAAAEEILDEQQKNSFISDKAKQSPVTNDEIGVVQTSGYIIVPWVNNYSTRQSDKEVWFCRMGVGFLIFSVDKIGGRWKTTLRAAPFDKSLLSPGSENFDEAFANAALSAAGGALLCLKNLFNFRDFSVTAQVLEHGFMHIVFSVPPAQQHWLKTDTRIRFYNLEGEGGAVERKNAGWGIIIGKTGAFSAGDPKIRAQVISGFPSTGTLVEEIKTSGGSGSLGMSAVPWIFKVKRDSLWKDANGSSVVINGLSSQRTSIPLPELCLSYPIGKSTPLLRQTFLDFILSAMWFNPKFDSGIVTSRKSPSAKSDTCVSLGKGLVMGIGAGLSKRFYFRRFSVKPFADFRYSSMSFDFKEVRSSDTITFLFGCPMVTAGSFFEWALSADFNVGVSYWYRRGFPYLWNLSYKGEKAVEVKSSTNTFLPAVKGTGMGFYFSILL